MPFPLSQHEPQALLNNRTLLVVDDEEPIRRILGYLLTSHGYTVEFAVDARDARQKLKTQPFALMLCDVNMPGESGMELIKHVLLLEFPFTAAVMVTGVDDPLIADIALKSGAYGYIIKPYEANEVLINVANALRRRQLEIENQSHLGKLEDMVMERTEALRRKIRQLEKAHEEVRLSREETVQRALAAEFRDTDTARHLQRMSLYCAVLARQYGLEPDRCELIRIASPMHDIGKIGTPDHILLKPGKFSPEEFEVITRHSEMGRHIPSFSGLLSLLGSLGLLVFSGLSGR